MGDEQRPDAANQHAPNQNLDHGHRGHAQDFTHHQLEGAHRRDHNLQHAVVLLLDDRLHDHAAVDEQEHVEHHPQHEARSRGDDRRAGLRILLLRLVVAEGLHVDRGLHLVENLRQVLDVVGLELLRLDDVLNLAGDVLLNRERRGAVEVEAHVVGVGHHVAADVEDAVDILKAAARLVGGQLSGFEAELLVALERGGHPSALVDDGDALELPRREAHDEGRRRHQGEHQHGHEQRGDDEGFLADALVELASDDDGDVRHGQFLLFAVAVCVPMLVFRGSPDTTGRPPRAARQGPAAAPSRRPGPSGAGRPVPR